MRDMQSLGIGNFTKALVPTLDPPVKLEPTPDVLTPAERESLRNAQQRAQRTIGISI
jgi:hypothetical protein